MLGPPGLHELGVDRQLPDVVLLQETARTTKDAEAAEAQLASRRWQPQLIPSVRTDGGTSAGVGVLARWSGTAADYKAEDIECRHPGRVAISLWSGVLARGVVVAPLCAYAGDEALGKSSGLLP